MVFEFEPYLSSRNFRERPGRRAGSPHDTIPDGIRCLLNVLQPNGHGGGGYQRWGNPLRKSYIVIRKCPKGASNIPAGHYNGIATFPSTSRQKKGGPGGPPRCIAGSGFDLIHLRIQSDHLLLRGPSLHLLFRLRLLPLGHSHRLPDRYGHRRRHLHFCGCRSLRHPRLRGCRARRHHLFRVPGPVPGHFRLGP